MTGAIVHNSHLVFNNKKYFRGGAESVTLGAYGEKRKPAGKANYLEVQDDICFDAAEIRVATVAKIDFERSRRAAIELGLRAVDTQAAGGFEALQSGQLELVKLELRLRDVQDQVEASARVREDLANFGADARISHEIWVVMSAQMARTMSGAGSISLSKSGGSGKLSVGGSSAMSLTLSPGTTYAYLLCQARWERDRIVKFVDDQWGVA